MLEQINGKSEQNETKPEKKQNRLLVYILPEAELISPMAPDPPVRSLMTSLLKVPRPDSAIS